ncbi:MAG: hypothetical protein ACPLUL_06585 [Thermanaerothrix sp.]|uniref:hypothetical protein n=1 Tax=Thermanaerothrix sp. TaxID=2972675 RepID=UPI003C7ECF86
MGEMRAFLVALSLVLLPGWAFLGISNIWKLYRPLQRWMVAFGLSVAFYPLLFYWARLLPSIQLGTRKLLLVLFIFALLIIWKFRKNWKEQIHFESSELIALLLMVVVLFTRMWQIHIYPYPAWSDSLHHTLLTQLTAQYGRLPNSLEPYEPVSLNMYHLGLYAFTAPIMLLGRVSATTALLVGAQLLNALNVCGIYLILDRIINRKGAIFGVLFAGLLSFQPAWYFNWGRFTQVSSQMLLPVAWAITLDTLNNAEKGQNRFNLWYVFAASVLNAGVFLMHFRVAGLYLPLLLITAVEKLFFNNQNRNKLALVFTLLGIGMVSLFFISSSIASALNVYFHAFSTPSAKTIETDTSRMLYFGYDLPTLFVIGLRKWTFIGLVLAILIGWVWRSKLVIEQTVWLGCLFAIGNFYLLPIPYLAFINFTGIMIMFYLPAALIFGSIVGLAFEKLKFLTTISSHVLVILLLTITSLSAQVRVTAIEGFRFFMTPQDEEAMEWIKKNVPKDAVFAIDTYLWLGNSPHGIDAGYWIPYYTGRRTTTGTMLFALGNRDYTAKVRKWSYMVSELQQNPKIAQSLCEQGVSYLYLGAKRDRLLGVFDPGTIISEFKDRIVFTKNGATIFKLCP